MAYRRRLDIRASMGGVRGGKIIHYGSTKVTLLILYGSLCVILALTTLLLGYDLIAIGHIRLRTIVGLVFVLYLVSALVLARKKRLRTVSWMLIILYTTISFVTLLTWGLNTAAGIFATSFVIILSGILLGSRVILPVTLCVALMLVSVQTIHSSGLITPDISALTVQSTFLDVFTYVVILGVFSLITWISDSQIEKSLERAHTAEATIRAQKASLATELERESSRLRQVQLKEIQQLYKFATLGQSTAATLHELSNHLSVLNMDIDDLKQQHQNSTAIANAKDGIEQVNSVVRQVRRQLDSYDERSTFNCVSVIQQAIKDQKEKFDHKHVALDNSRVGHQPVFISGNPLALMQIVTILLHNALDACHELPRAKVVVKTAVRGSKLELSVVDNGVGIVDKVRKQLFKPTQSTKPTGLGVGLYIAKHLVESHFSGSIRLEPNTGAQHSHSGAHFVVSIQIANKIVKKD